MTWIGAPQKAQSFPSSASCAATTGMAALAVLVAGLQLTPLIIKKNRQTAQSLLTDICHPDESAVIFRGFFSQIF